MIKHGIITTILTLALTLVSFGHRTLSPAAEAQAEAYILAGGNWAELCGESGDPLAGISKCMACVISQTCALLDSPSVNHPTQTATALNWVPQRASATSANATKSHPARGPPFRLI